MVTYSELQGRTCYHDLAECASALRSILEDHLQYSAAIRAALAAHSQRGEPLALSHPHVAGVAALFRERYDSAGVTGEWPAHAWQKQSWPITAYKGGDVLITIPPNAEGKGGGLITAGTSTYQDSEGQYDGWRDAADWVLFPEVMESLEFDQREADYGPPLEWPAGITQAAIDTRAEEMAGWISRLPEYMGSAARVLYCGSCGQFFNDGQRVDARGECPNCGESNPARFVWRDPAAASAAPDFANEFPGPPSIRTAAQIAASAAGEEG